MGGSLIKNRCARDLLAVVVNAPGQGMTYFPKLSDGETVVSLRRGRALNSVQRRPARQPATVPLSASSFRRSGRRTSRRARALAWEALGSLDWL